MLRCCFKKRSASLSSQTFSKAAGMGDGTFERAVALAALPPTGLTPYTLTGGPHAGVRLCLVTHSDRKLVAALYDTCPHKQAQMSLGDIVGDIEDTDKGVCVRCPRHRKKFPGGLKFRLKDGAAWVDDPTTCATPFEPEWALPVFTTRVDEAGWLWVAQTPGTAAAPPPDAAQVQAAIAAEDAAETASGGVGKEEGKKLKAPKGDKRLRVGAPSTLAASAPGVATLENSHAVIHSVQRLSSAASAPLDAIGESGAREWTAVYPTLITRMNHDTLLLRLVPTPLGATSSAAPVLPSCDAHSWHVPVRWQDPGLPAQAGGIEREYTPVSTLEAWCGAGAGAGGGLHFADETGWLGQDGVAFAGVSGGGKQPSRHIDLLVKVYPRGGLTSRLATLTAGSTLGPGGSTLWVGRPQTTLATPGLMPPPATASIVEQHHTMVTTAAVEESAGSPLVEAPLPPAAAVKLLSAPPAGFGPGSSIGLVCGGTGVTPMLQLLRWALDSPPTPAHSVPESVFLLCSNKSAEDALCAPTLRAFAARFPHRLRVLHTYTREGGAADASRPARVSADPSLPNLAYTFGRVSRSMLATFFPVPAAVAAAGVGGGMQRVVVSGPAGMWETVKVAMEEAGHGTEVLVELEA